MSACLDALAMTFGIAELDPDIDGTALDREEADINIIALKDLRLLILCVNVEDFLREVRRVTFAFPWLLLLL